MKFQIAVWTMNDKFLGNSAAQNPNVKGMGNDISTAVNPPELERKLLRIKLF